MQGEQAEIRQDDRDDCETEGFDKLSPSERAEFEAFLDSDLPPGWENAPFSAQVAFLVAGDDPVLFDAIKAELKGE